MEAVRSKLKGRLGYPGGDAVPLDVLMHELYLQSASTLRRKPELSNRRIKNLPDTSLEWLGKYEFELDIATAEEELVILGKVGAKFDTPKKKDALERYRYQRAIGNHLLFRTLVSWDHLDKLAELSGYRMRLTPNLVLDQSKMDGY